MACQASAMGLPDESLADPGQVAEELRCVICTEVFIEPVANGQSALLGKRSFARICVRTGVNWTVWVSASRTTLGVLYFPRSCPHIFCRPCITQALERKEECPLCREPMHDSSLRRCQPIQALVDKIQAPRTMLHWYFCVDAPVRHSLESDCLRAPWFLIKINVLF